MGGAGGVAHDRSKERGVGGARDKRERGARSERRRWGARRVGESEQRRVGRAVGEGRSNE